MEAAIKQEPVIRLATPKDAEVLLAIYAPYVRDTAITFEYDVPELPEFRKRIESTLEKYPYLVAERNGIPTGYAYAGPFHPRAAYQHSAELSIYLSQDSRGQGIGKALYRHLEKFCFPRAYTIWKPVSPLLKRVILTFLQQVLSSTGRSDSGQWPVSPNADTNSAAGLT